MKKNLLSQVSDVHWRKKKFIPNYIMNVEQEYFEVILLVVSIAFLTLGLQRLKKGHINLKICNFQFSCHAKHPPVKIEF